MNYAAMGEYTACKAQAQHAARKRCAALSAIGLMLDQSIKHPEKTLDLLFLRDMADVAIAAEAEMNACVAQANQAGALCGQAPIVLPSSWAAGMLDATWH